MMQNNRRRIDRKRRGVSGHLGENLKKMGFLCEGQRLAALAQFIQFCPPTLPHIHQAAPSAGW